jgi:hypothetical protein
LSRADMQCASHSCCCTPHCCCCISYRGKAVELSPCCTVVKHHHAQLTAICWSC